MINVFWASLTRRHVSKLIEVQDKVTEVDSAIKLIGRLLSSEINSDCESLKTKISTFDSPADLQLVEELNYG